MPISLSEWRVRIGTFPQSITLIQYLNLIRVELFLALLNILADGESKVEPSEKETSPTTTDHQSSSDKPPSNPEKDGTPSGVSSDEQKTPKATADQTKDRLFKGSKKRKHHNQKERRSGPDQSCGAFLSFSCFLKSDASPLLRVLLLVFTTILLLRSGDVELNPGPNESSVTGVSDIMLVNIAEALGDEMEIIRLGSQLKTSQPDIQRYLATNRMDGILTSRGTFQMLVDWRNRTRMQYQQTELREALVSSYLQNVADRYLPQEISFNNSDTFTKDLIKGKVACNRTRIMVVGPAGVGKTSFINRLTNQSFDQKEKSTVGTVNTHTTSQWKLETVPRDELAESLARRLNASREEKKAVKTTSHLSLQTTKRVSSLWVEDEPSDSNEGIEKVKEYAKGISPERIHSVTSSANDIIYSIWDFGGQEIYYITHPLFLSWRSLYIAVFPLHKNVTECARREEGQLEGCPTKRYRTMLDLMHFWMMSIYIHAVPPDNMKDPKILLVGTFCNRFKSKFNRDRNISKLLNMIKDKPYSSQVIPSVVQVDNKSSSADKISQIQGHIDDLITGADYMKEELPVKWRIFLDQTKDLHQDTLKLTKAREIMSKIGIRGDEVHRILQFCHDAGHLIYHQGSELIILQPEVLNSFVSKIITVVTREKLLGKQKKDWNLLMKKGVLTMDLIKVVWKQHEGKDDELGMVIDMMIKFDLMCEIQDTQGVYQERCFFVPCRSSPNLDAKQKLVSDDEFQFVIDFDHLLSDGFLHRLYVRMAKWAMDQGGPKNPSFHCREMLFYIDEKHRVKMSNDIKGDDAHRIMVTIYAISEDGIRNDNFKVKVERTFIEHLEDTLDELKETWARRITYTMGMICTNCKKHGETILVPLNKFLSCKGSSVCCDDCSASISVETVQQRIGLRSGRVSTAEMVSADCDPISDSKLNILSRHVPHGKYDDLSSGLGVTYNEADCILTEHGKNSVKAIRKCLAMWKDRTGGKLSELKEILHGAEIGGLVKYLEYVEEM